MAQYEKRVCMFYPMLSRPLGRGRKDAGDSVKMVQFG
jgi:hypothetical protein